MKPKQIDSLKQSGSTKQSDSWKQSADDVLEELYISIASVDCSVTVLRDVVRGFPLCPVMSALCMSKPCCCVDSTACHTIPLSLSRKVGPDEHIYTHVP